MQGLAGSTGRKFQEPVRNTDHPLEGYLIIVWHTAIEGHHNRNKAIEQAATEHIFIYTN